MKYKQALQHKSDFLTYLDVERNVSINTYKSYQYDLDQFFDFWHSFEKNKKITLPLPQALQKFFMDLYGKRFQKSSIARKIACFKSFEKYLHTCNIAIDLNLTTPKIEKKLPTYLTVDEINYLLDTLSDQELGSTRPIRDKTILETLYATGIRCSELCNIALTDINFDQQTIMITGKGNKQRIVIFGHKAKERLLEYIQTERAQDNKKKNNHLFLSTHGTTIQERSVQKILKLFSQKLPSKKQITPHKIRHSFATHLLNAGMNLRALQELLGHSSLATTEKYTHIATKDLKELYVKYNPLKITKTD
tara:strand:+ start:1187 stop:2104 length:918 start_codon:yes stop_codon:yes gene_type:complete